MKRKLWLAFLVVPALAFGLVSDVAAGEGGGQSGGGEQNFTAKLRAANETPPILGSNFNATARITINSARTAVCWDLEYTTTQVVRAAHIHKGAAGVPGPVVFGFFNPPPKPVGVVVNEGCRPGTPTELPIIRDIANHPGDYYVNIHTVAHPGGATRGQLTTNGDDQESE
jgi:hypothetical protein